MVSPVSTFASTNIVPILGSSSEHLHQHIVRVRSLSKKVMDDIDFAKENCLVQNSFSNSCPKKADDLLDI